MQKARKGRARDDGRPFGCDVIWGFRVRVEGFRVRVEGLGFRLRVWVFGVNSVGFMCLG